jgi:hypothetical protein
METFVRGKAKYEHHKNFAQIHEMSEKPGYIGKTVSYEGLGSQTWEQWKSNIIKSTQLIDKYLSAYIPKYYFTFNEETEEAVYFMEDVPKNPRRFPVDELDNFLAKCCEMYMETTKSGQTFMVDISNVDNFVYGNTISDPKQKLYFIDFYPFYLSSSSSVQSITIRKMLEQLSEFAKIYGENNFPKTQALVYELNEFQ